MSAGKRSEGLSSSDKPCGEKGNREESRRANGKIKYIGRKMEKQVKVKSEAEQNSW